MNVKNTDLIPFDDGQQNVGRSNKRWNLIHSVSGRFTQRPTVNGVEVALLSDPLGGDQNFNDLNDVNTSGVGIGSGISYNGTEWIPTHIVTGISGLIGEVGIRPADSFIEIATSGNNQVVVKNNGVTQINGRSRELTLQSLDNSISIDINGQFFNLQVVQDSRFFPVDSRTVSGSIIPDTDSLYTLGNNPLRFLNIFSDFGTFTNRPTAGGTQVALVTDTLPSSGVISINSLSGVVGISSTSDAIVVGQTGQDITLTGLYDSQSGVLDNFRFAQLINNSGFSTLNELLDVNVANPAVQSGQVLVYDGSNWVARNNIATGVGSVNGLSGEITIISDNDGLEITNVSPPTNEIRLRNAFTLASGVLLDQLQAASGFPTLNNIVDVDVATTLPVNGQALVYRNGIWRAEDQEAAGVQTINGRSGVLTFTSSTLDITSPNASTIDFEIQGRFPQKRSFGFVEASGTYLQFFHDLDTEIIQWSVYRNANNQGYFNIIPERITPSGNDLVVMELSAPTSGFVVLIG